MFKTDINKTKNNESKKYNIIVFLAVLTPILYFIMEIFSQKGISGAINFLFNHPLAFIYNCLIVLLPLTICLFFKRRLFVITLISILWVLFSLANLIILSNRVTPFTYQDFDLLVNQLSMITLYLSVWQLVLICVFLLALIVGLVFLFLKGPKHIGKINYKKVSIGVISYMIGFILVTGISVKTGIVETVFPNITISYTQNGFPYSWFANALNKGIHKPFNYSEENVTKLVENKQPDEMTEKPNIIMLQLESFFDPKYVKDWELSENPIPTFTKLKEEYTSGFLTVPGFGMGTVNTEFEVMTGMSVDFFGTGEYPYKTVLQKKQVESIAYNLLDLGYSTHAIHDNDATFYNRHKRFKNLGFETFTPIEFMNVTEMTPNGWAKDKVLTEEILKTLDSTNNPDYLYTISVQGHGVYPTEPYDENPKIKLQCSDSEEKRVGYEYYVNQLYEMDNFVKDLISELEKRDEKTILIMYGDHLPTFDISNEDLENGNIYQTEYIIWDNIGLEKKDEDLYAYQLSAKLGAEIGLKSGTMMHYHQNFKDSKDYLKNLKLLQYDMIYGKKYVYNQENPFSKMDMIYDVEDITFDSLYIQDGNLYVNGSNFTDYTTVYINGEFINTEVLSKELLCVKDVNISDSDEIYLEQFGKNGKSHLWKTETFLVSDKKK